MSEHAPNRRVIDQGQKIDLALQPVRLADGSFADRGVVVHRGAVALPAMVDVDHVCPIKNDRYATVQDSRIEAAKTMLAIMLRDRKSKAGGLC